MQTNRDKRPRMEFETYARAMQWRPSNRTQLVHNTIDTVRWTSDGQALMYTVPGPEGERNTLVEVATGSKRTIPDPDAAGIQFRPIPPRTSSISPDRRWSLETVEYDLILGDVDKGTATRLTFDGTLEHSYGSPGRPEQTGPWAIPVVALWSPDSRFVVTQRIDYRGVRATPITESAPPDGGLPRLHVVYTPFPGDERVPLAQVLIVDTELGTVTPAAIPPLPCTHSTPLLRGDAWWDETGTFFYVLQSSRDWRTLTLSQVDPRNGTSRELVTETSDRRIRPAQMFHQKPNVRVLTDDAGNPEEVIWFSERDGWGHLYLYDATSGECLRQLTQGAYVVQEILRVDGFIRNVWINVSGMIDDDPYRYTTCCLDLESGTLTRLFDDDLDHRQIGLLPDGSHPSWFMDVASTVSQPPVYTLRDWSGRLIMELETADVTPLKATGWREPERFFATGADGVTPIYGTIFFPPDFDPRGSYPVLDHLYPGPQIFRAMPFFTADEVEPMAALGIIGVTIDGRGTPGRSRAFHDASWNNLGGGSGLDDHVAVIRELASTRPWMDLERVGVYGHSAGGYAAVLAMEQFPEFFSVGIAASGRHEGRQVMAMILEAYDSPDDPESWERASAVRDAGNIRGKLLLVHGELDRGVTIHHTYQVIDRLIAAGRDYDLLVIPGDDHSFSRHADYVERRQMDYLVRHLIGSEPPPAVQR
jgi:dipeptidyl-peptidase-4